MQWIEIVAALFGVAYVLLAARQNILCWPAGLVNVSITFFVVLQDHLYGYALIQVFYFVMTIIAWYHWAKLGDAKHGFLPTRLNVRWLLPVAAIGLLMSGAFLLLFSKPEWIFTPAEPSPYPVWEAVTTAVFIIAMRLQALKKIENWLLWIAGDVVYAVIFFLLEFYFLAALSVIYIVVAVYGWYDWKRTMTPKPA
jgi:nicotinamide mononucleotide transporter